MLHSMDSELFEQIYAIMQKAWLEQVPQEWKDAYIVNLKKKVDKPEEWQQCDSWRGVSLLSIAGKAFTKIINRR